MLKYWRLGIKSSRGPHNPTAGGCCAEQGKPFRDRARRARGRGGRLARRPGEDHGGAAEGEDQYRIRISFVSRKEDKAYVVLRTDDHARTQKVLENAGIRIISEKEIEESDIEARTF